MAQIPQLFALLNERFKHLAPLPHISFPMGSVLRNSIVSYIMTMFS